MPVLVDTSVWIDFLRGALSHQVTLLEVSIRREQTVLGDLILCEVLQGIRDDSEFQAVRRHFEAFPVLPMVGKEIAIRSAVNYRALRAKGITVRKTIDCLIATFCIEHALDLLHNDRDFDHFEQLGLRVARWQ